MTEKETRIFNEKLAKGIDPTIAPPEEELVNKHGEKIKKGLLKKRFVKEYVNNGFNATRAYQAIRPETPDRSSAVISSRLLTNVDVKKEIASLLPSDSEDEMIIREAYNATRPKEISWKDLHNVVRTSLQLKGKLQQNNNTNVNIGLIIE